MVFKTPKYKTTPLKKMTTNKLGKSFIFSKIKIFLLMLLLYRIENKLNH